MKIGILTYHSTHNYGAFLQAYALCNALIDGTGNDTEIINFSMKKADDENLRLTKYRGLSWKKRQYLKDRYAMFETAGKRCHKLSGPRFQSDSIEEFAEWINGKYDAIVVGSDEIWALDGYRGFPTPYWLPMVTGCKKLSYAASSRSDPASVSSKNLDQIKEYLHSFDYIGVRDDPTRALIETAVPSGAEIHLNCDPVFVCDFHISKEAGQELIRDKFGIKGKKKCVALMLHSTALGKSIIKAYGSQVDFISLFNYFQGTKGCAVLDPFEWIEAIAGADGLITDFFHGAVFALKSNTPFLSFEYRKLSEKAFSKSYDLLKRNGLESHFHMIETAEEQTLRKVGSFLADILAEKAEYDFSQICENEKKRFSSFAAQFADL